MNFKLWFESIFQPPSYKKQESPPAWTQEAHHPPHSKCSLCCSVSWVGGVPQVLPPPSRPGLGYPLPSRPGLGYTPTIQTWSGVGYPRYPPRPGTGYSFPTQSWDGVPPTQTWDGVPSQTWDVVLPRNGTGYPPTHTWDGVPPSTQTWDGVPPQTWDGVPPYLNLGRGTPSKCGQSENITFRHPSDAGGKNCTQKLSLLIKQLSNIRGVPCHGQSKNYVFNIRTYVFV